MSDSTPLTLRAAVVHMLCKRAIPDMKGVTGLLAGISAFSFGLGRSLATSGWLMAVAYGVLVIISGLFLYFGSLIAREAYVFTKEANEKRGAAYPEARAWGSAFFRHTAYCDSALAC